MVLLTRANYTEKDLFDKSSTQPKTPFSGQYYELLVNYYRRTFLSLATGTLSDYWYIPGSVNPNKHIRRILSTFELKMWGPMKVDKDNNDLRFDSNWQSLN